MHLAAAVGTKCVAIFSAHNYPGQWEPYGEGHIIFRKDVECSPCYLMECPKGNLCTNLITVEEVINAVNKLAKEVPL
jgi:ADP-heptose:LPS heptosyltransferase